MWKNNNPSFCAGDLVWVRGCRDMLLPGVVIGVLSDAAQVRLDSRKFEISFEDLLHRKESDSDV